jgi:hypothetical protein
VIQPRLRAALVIGAIVVGSGIAGAAIDRAFVTRGAAVARERGGDRRGDGGRRGSFQDQEARRRTQMLDYMSKELSLTPAQRAGFDSVFKRTDSSLRAVRREMQPRLQAVFETSHAELRARLDTAQRVKFSAMRRHGPGRGRGDGYSGRGSAEERQPPAQKPAQ